MFENPFSKCTARDMDYQEVRDYWCSPFDYVSFTTSNEDELLKNRTPIIIEGARGSGKTMLLKHLSYYCQKDEMKESDDILSHFQNIGSIGIYLRCKEDFIITFSSLTISDTEKDELFITYYDLLLSREYLRILDDLFSRSKCLSPEIIIAVIDKISSFLEISARSLIECEGYLSNKIDELDTWTKLSRYRVIEIPIVKPNLLKSLVSIVSNSISALSEVTCLIIIDEYENAHEFQKVLNTQIKGVDETSNITYRIGVRTEGISTYFTDNGCEWLQQNRDFLLVRLVFSDHKKYKRFLKSIANKRLEKYPYFKEAGITDITQILGKKEDPELEAREIVAASKNRIKHFDIIENDALRVEALDNLRYDKNPLLEMLNIIWVTRGKSISETKDMMNRYLSSSLTKSDKYRRDYVDKYKYQLVYTLLKKHHKNKRKLYYSFTTYAFLSTGSVNDFISLCRNTFSLLDDIYFENIRNNPIIDKNIQTRGAYNTAVEQYENIQLNNEDGFEMARYIMNMGALLRYFHSEVGTRYPETTQFAFENEGEIHADSKLNSSLKRLLKWGVVIKKSNIQTLSVGKHKGNIYYLNHIYAPLFDISYRLRGGYNPTLSNTVFQKMLDKTMTGKEIYYLINNSTNNSAKMAVRKEKTLDYFD